MILRTSMAICPILAAICVYPNFAQVVRTVLGEAAGVNVACVAGGFPSSRLPRVKVAETAVGRGGR